GDPLRKRAPIDIFDEHARYAAQHTNVIASDDIRMQANLIDPLFCFPDEVFDSRRTSRLGRNDRLDGQFLLPLAMADEVHPPHAALGVSGLRTRKLDNLIQVKDQVARLPIAEDTVLAARPMAGWIYLLALRSKRCRFLDTGRGQIRRGVTHHERGTALLAPC